MKNSLGAQVAFVVVMVGIFFLIIRSTPQPTPITTVPMATSSQVSATAVALSYATSTPATSTSPTVATPKPKTATTTATVKKTTGQNNPASSPSNEISRIKNPYDTAPLSFADVNTAARGALVNILCAPHGGSLRPISGSGVLIDPRGVILTNAHVAQYVLLSESSRVNLTCYVRTGSPAVARFLPAVLYIPPVWVEEHAADINSTHPTGTGEHDYALLYITASSDATPLPASFPYLAPDTREAIGFLTDQVLAASYPAEFIGAAGGFNIYSASSVTTIRQLLTFSNKSVDVISVGGVIEAQSGSSGGAVVNAWGKLIGIISTTSDGATTADRDLRAITLSYINRDLAVQTGFDLATTLGGDPMAETEAFTANPAPRLAALLLDQILK